MRLNRLDLLRYGKFTDKRLDFPNAPRDFHLIIGPNEAGKSTLRSAIGDLLFGFPVRTPLDFLHAKSELRLGACVDHEGVRLDFLRLKGNKNTLRNPAEEPLSDTALDAFLAGASRGFFDHMFSLDHPRLVEGGKSILSAQDDVGRILFQSAAGVASLGQVRDALEKEADALWAPTRSSKRAYYIERARMEEAADALKAATVRTREWTQASEQVQALEDRRQALRAAQRERQQLRSRLERLRRTAPLIAELRDIEGALDALGAVASLPELASNTLADAEMARAMAQQREAVHKEEALRLKAQLDGIEIDAGILALADIIEGLERQRHQCSTYEADIASRLGQAGLLWEQARMAMAELGWPVDASQPLDGTSIDKARSRLPGLPARKQLEQLLRDHGMLAQALDNALAAGTSRQAEAQALAARLRAVPERVASPALRLALTQAKASGDPDAALARASAAVAGALAEQNRALADLGAWARPPEDLRTISWPSASTVSGWLKERQGLQFELNTQTRRHDAAMSAVRKAELELQQYRRLHRPVLQDEVLAARADREQTWLALKSGRREMIEAAPEFEQAMHKADALADARQGTAQEAAEMQALQHKLEHARLELDDAQRDHQAAETALLSGEAAWQARASQLGLPGMPLEHLQDWLLRKDGVLKATAILEDARLEQRALHGKQASLRQALAEALPELVPKGMQAEEDLALLIARAEAHIREVDDANVRRDALQEQDAMSRPMLEAAEQAIDTARARFNTWRGEWLHALRAAHLPDDMAVGAAEGALSLMAGLAEDLDKIRRIQSDYIDTMRAELQQFIGRTRQLAQDAGMALQDMPEQAADALRIVQLLVQRLAAARDARTTADSLARAWSEELAKQQAAEQAGREADARLAPLMELAGADNIAALAASIAQSDQQRQLAQKAQGILLRLAQDGDGLSREQLQAEVQAMEPGTLAAELMDVHDSIEQGTEQQSALAVELDQARRVLDGIAGADDAARAEARRQEALAGMSDAAERYIKVRTAERLLKWAIDRYREEKQGPMLGRASTLFSQFTLGSFERLRVDFDKEPMVLEGQRPDRSVVGISGLSDGTRDQLYLALRLAALELHLEQAPALPFIADDLFINYDDERAEAGLRALAQLSEQTQVIFFSHHPHLAEIAHRVFGDELSVTRL